MGAAHSINILVRFQPITCINHGEESYTVVFSVVCRLGGCRHATVTDADTHRLGSDTQRLTAGSAAETRQ